MRPLLVIALLAAPLVAGEDPRETAFKAWKKRNVGSNFKLAESENRKVIVRSAAKHPTIGAVNWLMLSIVPQDEGADVVREAIRVLAKFKSPETVARMTEIFLKQYKKDWESRALTIQAIAKLGNEASRPAIEAAFKDKDPRVQQAVCRAVGAANRSEFKDHCVRLLKHKVPIVRGAAAMALAKMRAEDQMPAIFNMFVADMSARARYDAWIAMKELSLEKTKKFDPEDWVKWWEEQRDSVAEGEKNPWGASFPRAKGDGKAYWFRMPVGSDRLAFVFDCSLRINNAFLIDIVAQRKLPKEQRIPNFFTVKTRWSLLQAFTNELLKRLPDKTQLAFVFFSNELAVFPESGKLLKLNKKARAVVKTHLDEGVKRSGTAGIYDGLEKGWGWLKDGEAATNFRKGADTILFATCSNPTAGKHKNKPDRIADQCWRIAVTRGVRFQVVGIQNHAYEMLKSMAKDSFGLYVHMQPADDTAEPQDLDFWPEKKKKFESDRKKRKR